MSFTVVLVGRPNVGKSTLFNRLAGKKLALVDDTPGVTRDWRSAPAHVGGLSFTVVDTAGLEDVTDDSLEARMRRQTEQALERADVALFIIDARAGITPLDRHFANLLRRSKTPVLLVANKTEGKASQPGMFESYELGLGDPIPLSAEHGEGMADLVEALLPYAPPEDTGEVEEKDDGFDPSIPVGDQPEPEEDRSKPIQIAIVGRPNVGKSTLLNSLLGEERVLTGPEAGMTRDAISVDWEWRDRRFKLVDTAGMRRRARVDEKVEKLAVADSLRVIRMANVVVLVVDAAAILDKQDLTIARLVISEGRALVIAVNKWDTVDDRAMALRQVEDKLQASLGYIKGVKVVTISALKGHKLDTLLDGVLETYNVWNRRIPTAQLNRWIEGVLEHHPPPLVEGRRVKIRYVTQVKTRPPTFALFVNKPLDLPESYQRYLTTHLRDSFDMPGVPVRLLLRKGKNPYAED
ncbi:ribosome biogenesis GTPase Der [Azospirillum oryzae]|uniref:GTPase Der n=1 Tax=Azospirillum oryzae TaxID=286727 RepID=A0A6N1AJF4_9PROT|nr:MULTISPECIES: ribosome biogenesis GTPase Der [Azospirillum]KAA0582559.1 ribosome biogenesis GTPase Der [Azospirillum sp. Sh1]KAA0590087.1 ribosome biogenesis GTPase Der [Azospirillum oryzae]PWC98505.1 GTPase Der [Azospirillum sp. TSO5]QKS51925.1 ribosome biogenesis GTPase Der [Azospirillum oryzae]GLR82533.1 GTPase Der [Azospirillum oryzae]